LKTEIIKIDVNNIDKTGIRYAAEVLRSGGLVAFPTETVYGLGANALNETAVKNIFVAKGRPSDNPLIVHIADKRDVNKLVTYIPECAHILMQEFWPGPITLIMEKSNLIPLSVTAGLNTVGIRMPSNAVAYELIKESGVPVAAPSANTSGRPSPTNASHVIEDLYGRVDVIIDAGNCSVGVESTVLDTTSSPPVIFRPGGITFEQLEKVLGRVSLDPAILTERKGDFVPKSPGMKYKHYSPKGQVIIIEGALHDVVSKINELIDEYSSKGLRVGVMATNQTSSGYQGAEVISLGDRENAAEIAANLFKVMREFDEKETDIILAESVSSSGIGLAIMNRLSKAAGYNIIKV